MATKERPQQDKTPPKAPPARDNDKSAAGTHAPDTPGFHRTTPEEQKRTEGGPVSPASLQLDEDHPGRVNTRTGDQPGNTGGSRTGTPQPPEPNK